MGSPESSVLPVTCYVVMVASAVLSGLGDIFIFRWAKDGFGNGLVLGGGLWLVSLTLMGYLFRCSSLPFSVVIVLMIVIHLLVDIAWDIAMFGSRLSGWQWFGVGLALAAVFFLQLGKGQPTDAP